MSPEDDRPRMTPQDIRRSLDESKKIFEPFVESIHLQAKYVRAAYEGLLNTGFTDKEALEIVKARGYIL